MGLISGLTKSCEECHIPLSSSYPKPLCPRCEENELFQRVKEYIRTNVVNEYNVAMQFNISVRQVKKWIKEGRIEYVAPDQSNKTLILNRCIHCGKTITIGSLCSDCMKYINAGSDNSTSNSTSTKKYTTPHEQRTDKMRFVSKDKDT